MFEAGSNLLNKSGSLQFRVSEAHEALNVRNKKAFEASEIFSNDIEKESGEIQHDFGNNIKLIFLSNSCNASKSISF